MTKYEWEKELKKALNTLSKEEQRKVFDFYNELFEDKIENEMTESQIISEFGNPRDVADKILGESEQARNIRKTSQSIDPSQILKAPQKPAPPHNEKASNVNYGKPKRKLNTTAVVLIIVLSPIWIGLFAGLIGLVVGLICGHLGLVAAGGGLILAGIVALVPSLIMFSTSAAVAIVQIGICFIFFGLGVILLLASIKLVKLTIKLMAKFFKSLPNLFYKGKEYIYED